MIADSRFRLRRRLPLAMLIAIAASPLALAQGPLDFLKSEKSAKYDLDPAAPDQLVGVVLDPEENPVEEATVFLRLEGQWNKPPQETTTDGRGQFLFSDLEAGKLLLMAHKGAYASRTRWRKWQEVQFTGELASEPPELRLIAAGAVRLRVLSADAQKPVANAEVALQYSDMPASTETDADGVAQLTGLPPNAPPVIVRAEGFAQQQINVKMTPGKEATVTALLPPGAVLTGRVTDIHGKPVERAYVALRDASDTSHPNCDARTDSGGRYTMPYAPAGMALRLDFGRDGFLDHDVPHPPLAAGAEPVEFNVTLQRRPYGGAVTGIVQDKQGEPIAGAEVANWGRSSSDKRVTYTDTEGRFEIYDVFGKDLGRYEVIVKAAGHVGQVVPFEPGPESEPGEVTISLEVGHKLSGRVVNEAGKPIAGARVNFGEQFWSFGESKRTDAEGKFAFDSLPKDVEIEVNASGYSEFTDKLPLDTDEVIDVTLQPKGVLRGVAVNAKTEQPITNFNVRITFSPERKPGDPSSGISSELVNPGQRHSSPTGWFDIDNLTVGQPFMVTVEAEGYRPTTVRRLVAVRASSEERPTLRMTPIEKSDLVSVEGQINYADGTPVVGAEVRLVASEEGTTSYGQKIGWNLFRGELRTDDHIVQHMRTSTDSEGRFRFEDVYGDLQIELAYFGGSVAPQRVGKLHELSREEISDLQLTAQHGAKLTITTDEATFPRVRSVRLYRQGDQAGYDPSLRLWRPLGDGSWQFESIAPGEYKLIVSKAVGRNEYGGTIEKAVYQETLNFAEGDTKQLKLTEPQDLD